MIKSLVDLYSSSWVDLAKQSKNRIFIYGAGEVAKRVKDILNEYLLAERIEGFLVDDEYYVKGSGNTPISEIESFDKKIDVAIGMYDYEKAVNRLKLYSNVQYIICIDRVFETERIDYKYLTENIEKFEYAYSLLADEKSKQVFVNYLISNVRQNVVSMFKNAPLKEQYMHENILCFLKDKNVSLAIFGAFDGKTAINLSNEINFKRIDLFEADSDNMAICKKNIAVSPICYGKVVYHEYAVGNKDGKVYFNGNAESRTKGMCRIESNPAKGALVNIKRIDTELDFSEKYYATFDIEGAEYSALKGAEKWIETTCPCLAISVYHKKDDLVKIPEMLKKYNSDYSFFLDNYVPWCEEVILYAIPKW